MALTDYSDMEKEIQETPDTTVLQKGAEVKVRIISVREGISEKNDAQWYSPVFEVIDDPLVEEFNDFIWDPKDNDKLTDKQALRNNRRFREFMAAIGMDLSTPFDWEEDLIGKECWVIVGRRESDEYGPQNSVKKYVLKK